MAKGATRIRWTAEQARRVVEAWESSGESVLSFANSIGIDAQRLYWWRRRLASGGTASLVPVSVVGATSVGSAPVVVTMRSGTRIEVHELGADSAAWTRAVLADEKRP